MYFSSAALARRIEKLAAGSWKRTGLSPSHAYLLMMVLDDPGIQPGALVEELLLSPSTITRLTDKLEEKKLVYRTAAGKMIKVFPTEKATAMQPELNACVTDFYEKVSAILGREESASLVGALNRITDKL
jgi:DNA-binding MarR family transcriptional regulator